MPVADTPVPGGRTLSDPRIAELVSRLSTRERAGQLVAATLPLDVEDPALAEGPPGVLLVPPMDEHASAAWIAALQDVLDARGQMPVLPVGLGPVPGAARHPPPLALAATWDRRRVEQAAAAGASAAAAAGLRATLGPALSVAFPARSRDRESPDVGSCFGGEPLLAAELVAAHVRGSQDATGGRVPADRVGCLATRFGAVGSPDDAETHVDERAMRSEVLAAGAAAVRSGVVGIVPATSSNAGVPAHADSWLLQRVLRGEWGFDGPVLSALGGVAELAARYRVATGPDQALALALEAGVDVDLDLRHSWSERRARIEDLLRRGALPDWIVDDAVAAVLRAKRRLGLLTATAAPDPVRAAAARRPGPEQQAWAVAETMVLLSDPRGLLPLARFPGGLGLVVDAEDPASRSLSQAGGLLTALRAVRPADPVRLRARPDTGPDGEVSVVLLSGSVSTALPDIARRAASRGGCIVVSFETRTADLAELASTTATVLVAWSPVSGSSAALAEILTGGLEPGGRMPIAVGPRPDGPLFPLGHGRGYTSFAYSSLRIAPTRPFEGESIVVECVVRNDGDRPGREVVQVYLRDQVSSVIRPNRVLAGFTTVVLGPGQSRLVRVTLPPEAFAVWDRSMRSVVEPGRFDVQVGHSAGDIRLAGVLQMSALRPGGR